MKKWTKFIKYVDSAEHFEAINYRSRSEWIKSTSYIYLFFSLLFFIFLFFTYRWDYFFAYSIFFSPFFFLSNLVLVVYNIYINNKCVCVCTDLCTRSVHRSGGYRTRTHREC